MDYILNPVTSIKKPIENPKTQEDINQIRLTALDNFFTMMYSKTEHDFQTNLKEYKEAFAQHAGYVKYLEYWMGNRKPRWAMAYLPQFNQASLTNNYIESFHNFVKSNVVGRRDKRIDEVLNMFFTDLIPKYNHDHATRLRGFGNSRYNKAQTTTKKALLLSP